MTNAARWGLALLVVQYALVRGSNVQAQAPARLRSGCCAIDELGRTYPVTWTVEDDDEFMHEAADTFSVMLGMPLIVVNKDQAA